MLKTLQRGWPSSRLINLPVIVLFGVILVPLVPSSASPADPMLTLLDTAQLQAVTKQHAGDLARRDVRFALRPDE